MSPTLKRGLAMVAMLVLVAGAAMAVNQRWQEWQARSERQAAAPGAVAKRVLAGHAAELREAMRVGDIAAAGPLFASLRSVLETMKSDPAYDREPLRYCRLAATHLARGADALFQQSTVWSQSQQFDAALAECR